MCFIFCWGKEKEVLIMSENPVLSDTFVDPNSLDPQTGPEFVERGWLYYAMKNYEKAIADYQKALSIDPDIIDTHYALAMALKYAGKVPEATDEFTRVINLTDQLEDKTRAIMITRLSKGHINEMNTGNWGLSKDLWQR
jgi:tetratricopeptide (TPR) repeat protein